jgi:uncharacterized membrane protein
MSRLSRPSLCSLLSALVLGLAACGEGSTTEPNANDDDGHDHDAAVASGAVCPPGSTLTFQNFGNDFMQRYCLSCHSVNSQGAARGGAPTDHNYDTVADVRRWGAEIDKHAAAGPSSVNTLMPPALPRPTQPEREQLGQWIACGAP